jgi:hypothetical protein
MKDSFRRIAFFLLSVAIIIIGGGVAFTNQTIGVILVLLGFIVMGYSFKSGS